MQLNFDRITEPVPSKTHSGKTYKDIEADLIAPLAPEAHKSRELGYDKKLNIKTFYIYVPWTRLRDRLRSIVGASGFRFEIVSMTYTQDHIPLYIGTLNILGVVHQGIGYGRSNEAYKGGAEEIAYADCFKNAAEQHGLGAYLDDQEGVVKYLHASGDLAARELAQKVAIQYQKANRKLLNDTASIQPSAPSTAKPTVKPARAPEPLEPTAEVISLYPSHNAEIKELRSRLNLTPDTILKLTNNRQPSQIPIEEYEELLKTVAVNWAVDDGNFRDPAIARTALEGTIYNCRQQGVIKLFDAVIS